MQEKDNAHKKLEVQSEESGSKKMKFLIGPMTIENIFLFTKCAHKQ